MASRPPSPAYYTPLPKDLTPEELNVIQYHRNNLDNNTFITEPDGRPTTFRGAVMGVDNGSMLFPRYRDGVVLEPSTAQRLAVRSGTKFPVYKDDETALAREQFLHEVMKADSDAYMKQKPKR
jgi:hypothetical protein